MKHRSTKWTIWSPNRLQQYISYDTEQLPPNTLFFQKRAKRHPVKLDAVLKRDGEDIHRYMIIAGHEYGNRQIRIIAEIENMDIKGSVVRLCQKDCCAPL